MGRTLKYTAEEKALIQKQRANERYWSNVEIEKEKSNKRYYKNKQK